LAIVSRIFAQGSQDGVDPMLADRHNRFYPSRDVNLSPEPQTEAISPLPRNLAAHIQMTAPEADRCAFRRQYLAVQQSSV
jgi:hypothetical protein